ncbi:hypothetical protein [Candidatus Foliamicus sp.]
MRSRGGAIAALVCLAAPAALAPPFAGAQTRDVNFAVVGKHAGYEQVGERAPERLYYSFFSEIFLADDTPLEDATLVRPDGREMAFSDQRQAMGPTQDQILLLRGERTYASEADLDAAWPDGEYVFRYRSPGAAESVAIPVQLGVGEFPSGPTVWLEQDGSEVAHDSVDPMQDLVVRYTPFASGRADPREICDDMIFVILRDQDNFKVDHSGRPFQGQRFMLYSDTQRVIPAAALAPASRYKLSVEHAILQETARAAGVPVMSTRAVTTALEFHTLPPLPQIMN